MAGPNDAVDESDVEEFDRSEALIFANGVDPATGGYALNPLSYKLLTAQALQRPLTPEELEEVAAAVHARRAMLGADGEESSLAERGWGVVFSANDPRADEKKHRLEKLLKHRCGEAGALYKVFTGASGIQYGEPGRKFLNRHGAAAGPVDPKHVPYYWLLVGSPQEIPFSVQTDIDSRHAVGRLDFDDLEALEQYAERVVAREEAGVKLPHRAAFFATSNPGDVNTSRSAKRLAKPAADAVAAAVGNWHVDRCFVADATKDRLRALLLNDPPSLLFTATHGLSLKPRDPAQREQQGALVTQAWPGPLTGERQMEPDEYFTGADVPANADLKGLLAFFFACFGAGTPKHDEFLPAESNERRELAAQPFVARLPQRLLMSGAAAVMGHIERAWSCSFLWPGAGAQTGVVTHMLQQLAGGARVGAAAQLFNDRCNEIAFELARAIKDRKFGLENDEEIAALWLAQTDAENYAILGDPAVRLVT